MHFIFNIVFLIFNLQTAAQEENTGGEHHGDKDQEREDAEGIIAGMLVMCL